MPLSITDYVNASQFKYGNYVFESDPTTEYGAVWPAESTEYLIFPEGTYSIDVAAAIVNGESPPPTPEPEPEPEPQNEAPVVERITVSPDTTVQVWDPVDVTVTASDADGDTLEYRFRGLAGEDYSAWSDSDTASFSYDDPGSYRITAQVRDPAGLVSSATANVVVITDVTVVDAPPSLVSSQLARSRDGGSVWAVNPDNGTVSQISMIDHYVLNEFSVGQNPRSIAVDSKGNLWVTLRDEDAVAVFDTSGGLLERIPLGYGAAPEGIVIDGTGATAYVALYSKGELLKIDTASRQVLAATMNLPTVKSLALSQDGERLLATRYISPQNWGEVWDVNTDTMVLNRTIQLAQSIAPDDIDNGRGVPNYLSSVLIDEKGQYAYVVGKKDNTGRGLINGNEALDDDNSVRTFAAKIDLASGAEDPRERIDFDNADSPSALALSPNGNYLFVALQGNNQVFLVSRDAATGALGNTVSKFATGLAPQGLLLDAQSQNLFTKNYTDRSVTVVDVSGVLVGNVANPGLADVATVSQEVLSGEVLLGKQIFYNASFGQGEPGELTGRMSAEGYLSCATCHQDGGQDGRVFDFTARGEGLRNNISLNGSSGNLHGNLHWSGNFDEVQDFELDIRHRFLGRGLMDADDFAATEDPLGARKAGYSEELDALAAFVSSLDERTVDRSPHRTSNGEMTASAIAGAKIFRDTGCAGCHSGTAFTDGKLHNVGTLREYSGSRLGDTLPGIVTPALPGLFNTAPYLHDGSAKTLEAVFKVIGGDVLQAEDADLSGAAEVVVPSDFSYLRRGAGVRLGKRGSLQVTAESSVARKAYVRVRYGSVSAGSNNRLKLYVNGIKDEKATDSLPSVGGEDVAFEDAIFSVRFDEGENTLKLQFGTKDRDATVVIDDLTISTEENEVLAEAHTAYKRINETKRKQLIDYLLQLDRGQ